MGGGANPARGKAKPAGARKSQKNEGPKVHDLERRLAEALKDTAEAQEQHAATAEILRVISNSPADAQPVFDAIAVNALRLCDAEGVVVARYDGALLHVAAHHNVNRETVDRLERQYPQVPSRDVPLGKAVLDGVAVHVPDLQVAVEFAGSVARQLGAGSHVAIPLLYQSRAIGGIGISRRRRGHFSDNQITLLKTFAAQAVIAIENARLFNETKEALERETASGEILRVISSSPTDVQPVLDAVATSAARLCEAPDVSIFLQDADRLRVAARHGAIPSDTALPLSRDNGVGAAVLAREAIHVRDMQTEVPRFPVSVENAQRLGFRTVLNVPLMRESIAIGAISLRRTEAQLFSERQVTLLQTFADQAVIAIENVRLFTELEARNQELRDALEQQTATSELLKVIGRFAFDLQPVFETLAQNAVRLCEADRAFIERFDGQVLRVVAAHNVAPEHREYVEQHPIAPGRHSAAARAALEQRTIHIHDVHADPEYTYGAKDVDPLRTVLAVPIRRPDALLGVILIYRHEVRPFTSGQIALIETFANQAAIAIENVRLFEEIADKSRELEVASQHKSEFLANMSHELRTPLNAIIGFSEVLTERMFGELNEKQEEYLKDIHASGQHLLSLINDILDLSKIEAGKMDLELSEFDLAMTIDNVSMLVRERAARRSIALHMTVDARLGQIQGDERKMRQVLLNLLSNAIKFTPEGGRIEVGAKPVNGSIEVSVTDTGVGIAPEDQEAVFEEFKQVGTADKKIEGTGLGLALSRKFIELHGGRIWVKSQVGAGSTFTFTVPVRRGE